ncbi:hypothetical protein [Ferrovum myxofaciens]|uniref:hypothetical protein n=1 Tax=Ferrovum myxofaciens TaxID=416213 RepID=UPI003EB9216F
MNPLLRLQKVTTEARTNGHSKSAGQNGTRIGTINNCYVPIYYFSLNLMVHIDEKELSMLFQQGIQGNASSFVLLARRLVSRLKKSDPASAILLAETLSSMPSVTRSVTQPVDSDSRRSLLKEEAESS